MKIEAIQRLNAMAIHRGNNFTQGERVAFAYLNDTHMSDLRVLQTQGTQVLVSSLNIMGSVTYMLVSCRNEEKLKDLLWGFDNAKHSDMNSHGARSIDALITVYMRDGTIDAVWVNKRLRGQGYGKALYVLAYNRSKKGIRSSESLGTMSLSVWLSMFRTNKKIELWVNKKLVPRKTVRIEGIDIWVPGLEVPITNEEAPDFNFWWPK